ncbi:MAG: hypothetical protein V9G98_25535 [Candidatus Competibacter sp.]
MAATDQGPQQVRMDGIVAAREGAVLREFALDPVELVLTHDHGHGRHWNPLRRGCRDGGIMGPAYWMSGRAPDTGWTIASPARVDLAGVHRIGENPAHGGQAPEGLAGGRGYLAILQQTRYLE